MFNFKTILFSTIASANIMMGHSSLYSLQTDSMVTSDSEVHLYKILPNQIKWSSLPALPSEIKAAILYGNPSEDGPLVLRLRMPAGAKIAPHWHLIDENLTVLFGSINIGSGDQFNQENSMNFPVGSFVSIPAKHHHYAWVSEDTVVQLNNFGKWQIVYVNPSDDPRNK